MDVTFQIIPKQFHPYKLLIISAIDENNFSSIILFILIKFLDKIAYERIFDYIYLNFNFDPNIIHTDFEKAMALAIKNNKYFKKTLIHSRCFFHYSKMIRGKLAKAGLAKKKLNCKSCEILKNVELLCFLDIKNIKKFQNIIIDNLEKEEKIKPFINYLKNYLFKLNPKIYNYSEIIKYFKNQNNDKFIKRLYTTNNICESLNSKINFYLPKTKIDNKSFIDSITKVLLNSLILKTDIIRKDYTTQNLLALISDMNLNKNLKWIKYTEFKESLKNILYKDKQNFKDNDLENWILNFYDIDSNNNNYNLINENNYDNHKQNMNIINNNDMIQDNIYKDYIDEIFENKTGKLTDKKEADTDSDYDNYISNADCKTNENICDLIDNLNLDDNNVENNLNSKDKTNEEKNSDESNYSDNNSNNDISYYKKPLKERIIKRLKYPKIRKRKKDYSSSDIDEKMKRKSNSKNKGKMKKYPK